MTKLQPHSQRSSSSHADSSNRIGRHGLGVPAPLAVRAHNERLVLSLVRRHGSVARAELARLTGLSAQAVSVIIRSLEEDGLLTRGKPVKGKVGQPLVPMSLAPKGAFSFGLKVGRRSADLILMNLVGEVCGQLNMTYAYPLPGPILDFVETGVSELEQTVSPANLGRISGLGIAAPSELWNWADKVGAEMEVWKTCNLAEEIGARIPYPIALENDATAACGAELMFGHGQQQTDYLYVFIGTFIGGGVVTGGRLFSGSHGNGGALGSMPAGRDGQQLIDVASLFQLEDKLRQRGLDPVETLYGTSPWSGFEADLRRWIKSTARHLSHAITATSAVIDMPAVIIDGGLPEAVKIDIVRSTQDALEDRDMRGLVKPAVLPGLVGANARAIGAASLPLLERFLLDNLGASRNVQHVT